MTAADRLAEIQREMAELGSGDVDLLNALGGERMAILAEEGEPLQQPGRAAAPVPATWERDRHRERVDRFVADVERFERLQHTDLTARRPLPLALGAVDRQYQGYVFDHEKFHAGIGQANGDQVLRIVIESDGRRVISGRTEFAGRPSIVAIAAGGVASWVSGYTRRGPDGLSDGDVAALRRRGYGRPDQRMLAIVSAVGVLRRRGVWPACQRIGAELEACGGTLDGARVREILRAEGV